MPKSTGAHTIHRIRPTFIFYPISKPPSTYIPALHTDPNPNYPPRTPHHCAQAYQETKPPPIHLRHIPVPSSSAGTRCRQRQAKYVPRHARPVVYRCTKLPCHAHRAQVPSKVGRKVLAYIFLDPASASASDHAHTEEKQVSFASITFLFFSFLLLRAWAAYA